MEDRFCRVVMICMERYSKNIMKELEGLLISNQRVIEMKKALESNPDEDTIIKKIREIKKG